MRAQLLRLAFGCVLALVACADEQDDRFAALPAGSQVNDARGVEAFALGGKSGALTIVSTEARNFAKAARVRTDERPANSYELQLSTRTTEAVKKGDKLLAIFEARAVSPQAGDGVAEMELVFEESAAPYTKSAEYHAELGLHWRRFYVPFEAAADYAAGRAQVNFRLGFGPQTVELGAVRVLDYGADFDRKKLPYTPASYGGREADAPWRAQAEERIERIRKGDLTVTVVGDDRRPLAGAKVKIRMKRHAFAFGSAVDARALLADGPDGDRYRMTVALDFNKVVFENDLKWQAWQGDHATTFKALDWLREHQIPVRGHCLIWPGKENLPQPVIALLGKPDELRRTLLDHVTDEVTALRRRVVEWDVVNEPFSNFDVQTSLTGVTRTAADAPEKHAAILAEFFRAARAADPSVKLDINDYSILETSGKDAAHQDHYERTIRAVLAADAPLNGIGIQGHFSEDLTPIPRLWEILDRFGVFKLPIQITEFDVNTYDEALQADYTRDFLIAMFAHERVIGVLTWGFWEKRHWLPNAAFYRADWSLRPAGRVWQELVKKRWWTEADGITGADGTFRVRGFAGDYEITVANSWKTTTFTATLRPEGTAVSAALPR
jgi:GH35 family endo-1,4-beta-xylanase